MMSRRGLCRAPTFLFYLVCVLCFAAVPPLRMAAVHIGPTAVALAAAAVNVYVPTLADFIYVLTTRHSDLRVFVVMALAMRRNRRTRRTPQLMVQALAAGGRLPRWATTTLQAAYGLYVVTRLQAAPRLPQPTPWGGGVVADAVADAVGDLRDFEHNHGIFKG